MGIEIETERLRIRPAEADDLPALHGVLASNPKYLELTEGSGGEAGQYDRTAFQRDWQVASVTGREVLGAYLRRLAATDAATVRPSRWQAHVTPTCRGGRRPRWWTGSGPRPSS